MNLRRARSEGGALRLDQVKLQYSLDPETGLPNGYSVFQQKDSNKWVGTHRHQPLEIRLTEHWPFYVSLVKIFDVGLTIRPIIMPFQTGFTYAIFKTGF